MSEERVTITMNASDARNLHTAASKCGVDRKCATMQTLYMAFAGDTEDMPEGDLSFNVFPSEMKEVVLAAQEHARNRSEKGHNASSQKYYEIARSVELKLIMRGVWL